MEEEIWNESFNMTQPTLESSSEAILIYDKRGTDIHVYNMEQKLGSFITNSPILFARVSANGNVLAAVEDGEGKRNHFQVQLWCDSKPANMGGKFQPCILRKVLEMQQGNDISGTHNDC
jgi:hypothetical protein